MAMPASLRTVELWKEHEVASHPTVQRCLTLVRYRNQMSSQRDSNIKTPNLWQKDPFFKTDR